MARQSTSEEAALSNRFHFDRTATDSATREPSRIWTHARLTWEYCSSEDVVPEASPTTDSARRRVLELVRRYGWNATAFQVLGPGFRYFFHGEGCVAYVDTGSAWVAAGAPVAATDELAPIARAFFDRARETGRRACFFATEDRFVAATQRFTHSIWIGEQAAWDPRAWEATLQKHSSLREQLRRARAKNVTVRQLLADPGEAERFAREARELTERWLATRAMPPMGFLVQLGTASEARHHFVAERAGRLVGLAQVIPVPQRHGWFIEHLLRDPSAPNGTVETLFDAVLCWARSQGSTWVTLGLAPLAGDVAWPLRFIRRSFPFLYNFEGLLHFKAKLRPNEWQPIHLTRPKRQGITTSIVDVLAAFATDGLVWFGFRTLARGPAVVLSLLTLLLVPWIGLIVAAPARYFAHMSALKWGWVAFDVALVAGLTALQRAPSLRLATLLAVAVTFDAVLTLFQAALTVHHWAQTTADVVVVAIACLAPAFAAVVLWGARAGAPARCVRPRTPNAKCRRRHDAGGIP
jgi:phosphatidylglycerol lysyltransferase